MADRNIVVLGGGIIGMSVAYEAACRGWRPLVLERSAVGSGAAWAAAGMLAPAAEAETEDRALVDLALESCRRYPEFVAAIEADSGLRCGYRPEGSLVVALNRDDLEELERLAAFQSGLGLDVRWLTGDEVLRREPALSPRVVGGLFAEGDRQVNPRQLVQALKRAVVHRGGEVVEFAEVAHIDPPDVAYTVDDMTIAIHADVIVAAAGTWTNTLPGSSLRGLSLRPVKGQILRLHGAPIIQHVVRTPDVYLVPRADGELVVGATSEEMGFDARPTAGAALDLLHAAWRVLPGSAELEFREHTVGFRPALRDNLPAIGASGIDGLFIATGHYRHGVMLAPVTAQLLMDQIETGRTPELLAPFQPSRMDKPGLSSPRSTQ